MFNDHRPLLQLKPARAKKKVEIQDLNESYEYLYTEQKIDGERFVIHTHMPTPEYLHGITSRGKSVITDRMVEKTDRVPHLSNHPQLPERSQFDTEFVSSGDIELIDLPGRFWDKLREVDHPHMIWLKRKFNGALPVYPHVSHTASILGSLGPEAIKKQQERGRIWAYCFDIIRFEDVWTVHMNQVKRRGILARILESVKPETGLILMPAWIGLNASEIEELFWLITNHPIKGEGLILKDPYQPYDGPRNWWKLKRDYPSDVILTGKCKVGEQGKTGQMLGMASSLEIGVYHNGLLHPIGWVSAIMDGMHNLMTPEEAYTKYLGKVIECRHNGLQKDTKSELGFSLRHPRFRRWRADKNSIDCTLNNVKAESR